QAMAMELLWPYVKNNSISSVERYLVWVKEQQDLLYLIKYEQAIRTNNPILKRAARRVFSPVWSARCHPIYHLIEAADEIQLMKLHPEIRDIIEKNCIVSWSGLCEQHQGLDAIIKEINK
ncbi:11156_t:CDS:2, partial [Scutellospora calospora]